MAKLYILQNENGKYYIGSTTDLEKRLKHHLGGHTPSTKRLGKLKLVFRKEYTTLAQARRIESKLKRLKRKDYIKKIINDGDINMKP